MPGDRSADKHLRQRCLRLLAELQPPDPFDLHAVCHNLERRRRRPLLLRSIVTDADDACGAWIATDASDYIFFKADTTPAHQLHIVLHELGHLLFAHRGSPTIPALSCRQPADHIPPTAIRTAMRRSSYDDRDEREAEMFACVAGERIGLHAGPPGLSGDPTPEVLAQLQRLASAFGYPPTTEP